MYDDFCVLHGFITFICPEPKRALIAKMLTSYRPCVQLDIRHLKAENVLSPLIALLS